jgi:hypothetical protein
MDDFDIDDDGGSNVDSETGEPHLLIDPENEDGCKPADDVLDENWECDVVEASMYSPFYLTLWPIISLNHKFYDALSFSCGREPVGQ